ncbi:hypothetical protein [Microbacterium sp. BR1]|uniref:hypothetical protein n=1 Tax=Microbacterium sp. BR1 TaxID=1070896 RepID=UPI000C2C6E2A|nr:hypothetical protein [Microbacterium sp. BR1]
MALNTTILNIGASAMRTAITHASTHTATPNASGSNEGTAGREAITWNAASAGDFDLATALAFAGGASGEAVAAIGLWSAGTSGTFYGYFVPTGDTAFNAAGEYTVTEITVDGSVS